ncbi:Mannosyl-oligosaccharide 1,2-alpha-mannosidase MNS2 [Cyphellophora attinorum]|uniref:alpha-1,2-Mannosidase n=1 Tax=Cyphellophora attinorum TaxID=1664694 RepID=A0A0N0NPG1_9EURO|nr:Mannosyl-oligosaccharide 1,2-alpha-mannosidase MNS2 [Phialophora attinorum]KPI42711.1 Mannosyl-oligosaccharide 1,2-alpha-mannosidase MNS2 [Phialophora attinorum]
MVVMVVVASYILRYDGHTVLSVDRVLSKRVLQSSPNTTWDWSQRRPDYPISTYQLLPAGKPRQLPQVQATFDSGTTNEGMKWLHRRRQVKAVFERCWSSYRTRAWPYDELYPISGGGHDTFGGWAATLVDSLDTLWIMDMKEDFATAVLDAGRIDFSNSTDEIISIFETTIRYLGGFLSAYDLSGNAVLLRKAVEVGNMLLVAFDTPNHMPIAKWDWRAAKEHYQPQVAPVSALISELGSLSLEFTRLSQITGDVRWYDAIARVTNLFLAQQNATKLPGMWPISVNVRDEDLTSDYTFTLGAMSDSCYEYFPKMYALLGGLESAYQQLYTGSMAVAMERMFFRPMTPGNADILLSGDLFAKDNGTVDLDPRQQHLTCFSGGMLGLGGRLFNMPDLFTVGRKLTDGCVWAYQAMPWRVMPDSARFVPCEPNSECNWAREAWLAEVLKRNESSDNATESARAQNLPEGFTQIDDPKYRLRPEAIESMFVMYRITGDVSYRDKAWEMFQAIDSVTRTELANAELVDVTTPGTPIKDDRMESFWLAETLKYFYLIFSDEMPLHVTIMSEKLRLWEHWPGKE